MNAQQPAADFLIYSCGACGRRIFTERAHQGQRGLCPLCGQEHTVGGEPEVEAEERRGAPRVEVPHAQVALERTGAALPPDQLAVVDLSETGIGLRLPALRDTTRISGFRPPPLQVGDRLVIALRAPGLPRPRRLVAEVRRVLPRVHRKQRCFEVGAQFVDLGPELQEELRQLVTRQGGG